MQTGAVPMCVVPMFAHAVQPVPASFLRLADSAALFAARKRAQFSVCFTLWHAAAMSPIPSSARRPQSAHSASTQPESRCAML